MTPWPKHRLKFLVRINERTLPEDTPLDREFRYIDIGSVGRGVLVNDPEQMTFAGAPSRARRLLRNGDTIISTVRTYLRAIWAVAEKTDDDDIVASTGFAVLTPGPALEPRFLGWWAQSDVCVEEIVARSVGMSYPTINASEVGELTLALPPHSEQCRIAEFLHAETARIDALIEKKRLLISLLEERRVTVLTDGVHGRFCATDRCVAAIPWLDDRPIHWRETKLTLVARLGSGHTPSRDHPEWWEDTSIPWITTGEVAQMRSDRIEYITETREMVSELGVANSAAEIRPAGTVVLCRTAASAGYSAIMGCDMATSQDFATWTCGPLLLPRFLLLCLRAMRQDLLGRLAMGSTHKTIYMPDIEAIRVPIPPVAEQDRIVEEVWRRLRPADEAVDDLSRQIDLLIERRHTLITAAVTGELDLAEAV